MHLSKYGLIHLTYQELTLIKFNHLLSGVDTELISPEDDCGRPTELSGFTEWTSETEPIITIGWDWSVKYKDGFMYLERVGQPRSNLMLVDDHKIMFQWIDNLDHLSRFVDSFLWSKTVQESVSLANKSLNIN